MRNIWTLTALLMLTSCASKTSQPPCNFAHDLAFLQEHDSVVVLKSGQSQVIVSPKYQAKVFTSTSDGNLSFGWIHYKAFEGPEDPHINAYGGENRLWLGPEGGPFSLFFKKGDSMEFKNWKTPPPFDTESWQTIARDSSSVYLSKSMHLINYAGTDLSVLAHRSVHILSGDEILRRLGPFPAEGKVVGYETRNSMTNTGTAAWTETTGMPCIWILDMFPPSEKTTIVIPYHPDITEPAHTGYFGAIPAERISYSKGLLYYKADGKSRGKLGIIPEAATKIAGSYDAVNKVLTIIQFDTDTAGRYLNQEWVTTKPPFSGDAVNAYNDGPLADGGQLGPFYELESVSPAAFLQPGETLSHNHAVFHFTGSDEVLSIISQRLLGATLQQINSIFK